MASTNAEKFNLGSMKGTTRMLCPCLTLLIEILLNEGITKNSEVSAMDDIGSAEVEGRGPIVSDPLIGI